MASRTSDSSLGSIRPLTISRSSGLVSDFQSKSSFPVPCAFTDLISVLFPMLFMGDAGVLWSESASVGGGHGCPVCRASGTAVARTSASSVRRLSISSRLMMSLFDVPHPFRRGWQVTRSSSSSVASQRQIVRPSTLQSAACVTVKAKRTECVRWFDAKGRRAFHSLGEAARWHRSLQVCRTTWSLEGVGQAYRPPFWLSAGGCRASHSLRDSNRPADSLSASHC